MNIIGKRKIWYAISLLVIVPGLISLFMKPHLKLGIDFTGGSQIEVEGTADTAKIEEAATSLGFKNVSVVSSGPSRNLIRYRDEAADSQTQEVHHQAFKARLEAIGAKELSFDTVGSAVSKDIGRNAILAILFASIAIVLYIAYAFRNVPPPVSSLNFGTVAIIALLHDALLVIGIFSLLGRFAGVEIDALFVTAILTVIGFSVHDTIVVFDRIRENLRRERKDFATIVNDSILETFARSINTSVTVLLTLLALYLFGGQSIRYFVLALLIGIAAGAYSSIFTAAPMLVSWHNYKAKRNK